MRKLILAILSLGFALQAAMGQGQLVQDESVTSHFLNGKRTFHVYLPPSYRTNFNQRYPVLYLQDGQNVFSSAGTNVAFGWGSWQLDKTVDELVRTEKMPEIIMVAVDSGIARFGEYNGRMQSPDGTTAFEDYAEFLMEELKPRIDREYRTKADATNTATMGSSLGGICSVALAWEHPEVFGKAASLSGAFQVDQTNFLKHVLATYQGKPKSIRVYLDSGVMDFTGGDDNRELTEQVYKELRRIEPHRDLKHYVEERTLTLAELEKSGLRHDKWAEAQSSQHNELYWRFRSWRALTFLFPENGK